MVASVGYHAITQQDVIQEYHFERFLDGQSPTGLPGQEEFQAALNRLISQTLLAEQMRTPGRNSKNGTNDAKDNLKSAREKFPNEQAYRAALGALGMTEQQVLNRIKLYQRTLQMINNRLRPTALPDPKEVESYYKDTFVPEYAKEHTGQPPPLDEVRDQIRDILAEKKLNELLDNWLDRLKSTHRVTIHSN